MQDNHPNNQTGETPQLRVHGNSPTTPRRAPKTPLEDTPQPQRKRLKWDASETLDGSEKESGDIFDFNPTELVKNREGSFVISKSVETYPLYQGDV